MTTEPNPLAQYNDDALAEIAEGLKAEADRLFRAARAAHQELTQRLVERGGAKLDTEHWTGALRPGLINHTVDDVARFYRRLAAINPAVPLALAFVQPPAPPMRVNHAALNDLHKLGGQVAAVIDEERRSVRSDPTLVLTRKMEAPE